MHTHLTTEVIKYLHTQVTTEVIQQLHMTEAVAVKAILRTLHINSFLHTLHLPASLSKL